MFGSVTAQEAEELPTDELAARLYGNDGWSPWTRERERVERRVEYHVGNSGELFALLPSGKLNQVWPPLEVITDEIVADELFDDRVGLRDRFDRGGMPALAVAA